MRPALLACLLLAAPRPARGAEASLAADVASAYVWRGLSLRGGPVVQPAFEASQDWLTVGAWADLGLTDCDGCTPAGTFDEVDLYVDLAAPIEAIDLSVGWVEYLLPESGLPGTREVYASIGAGWEVFEASFTAWYDLDEVDDAYLDLSLLTSLPVADDLTVDGLLRAGWAGPRMAAGGQAGMHDLEARLTLGYQLSEAVELHFFGAAAPSLDRDVLPAQDNPLYGGGGGSFGF